MLQYLHSRCDENKNNRFLFIYLYVVGKIDLFQFKILSYINSYWQVSIPISTISKTKFFPKCYTKFHLLFLYLVS